MPKLNAKPESNEVDLQKSAIVVNMRNAFAVRQSTLFKVELFFGWTMSTEDLLPHLNSRAG